jgi:hypothetical protein
VAALGAVFYGVVWQVGGVQGGGASPGGGVPGGTR